MKQLIANRIFVCLTAFILTAVMISCGGEKPKLGPNDYDVVVVGSGGGGLSAAARLAKKGMKVLVIEQHYQVGGFMSSFERKGYRFEASLHAMDYTGVAMFEKLGIKDKVKVVEINPAYIASFPGLELEVPVDVKEYIKRLKALFPKESDGIDKLVDNMWSIQVTMQNLMNLQDKKDVVSSIASLIFKPWNLWPVIKYWSKNNTEMMHDFVKDEKLIGIFTQLMCYSGVPSDNVSGMLFAMMWNSYHFGGFYYFHGGSHAITKACAEVVQENGGTVLLSHLVTKINIKDGKAVSVIAQDKRTNELKEFKCRYVVSNANAPDTFFKLVGREYLPADYVKRIETGKIGLSPFGIYLGVNYDYSNALPNHNHTVFVNPTFDQGEIFKYYKEGTSEKCQFALVNYTMIDPTNAPKGKNAIEIISIMPYDYKGDWDMSKGYNAYKALKEKVAWDFIRRIEKWYPGISKHIEVLEVGTPRTMERYTLNPKGTIFGWEYTIDQSMFKRLPHNTPIENLFLAGAWTFPGGGQSTVLISGVMCSDLILSEE